MENKKTEQEITDLDQSELDQVQGGTDYSQVLSESLVSSVKLNQINIGSGFFAFRFSVG